MVVMVEFFMRFPSFWFDEFSFSLFRPSRNIFIVPHVVVFVKWFPELFLLIISGLARPQVGQGRVPRVSFAFLHLTVFIIYDLREKVNRLREKRLLSF
jgi:hypothetical protein